MSNEPQHTYTREMMIDRLNEIRTIFCDERSKVGDMIHSKQIEVSGLLGEVVEMLTP